MASSAESLFLQASPLILKSGQAQPFICFAIVIFLVFKNTVLLHSSLGACAVLGST